MLNQGIKIKAQKVNSCLRNCLRLIIVKQRKVALTKIPDLKENTFLKQNVEKINHYTSFKQNPWTGKNCVFFFKNVIQSLQ